jgi:RNA-directed DNA polymerase
VWILDADLAGAFDKISHGHLLEMLGGFPAKEMIAGWLKAGIFEAGKGFAPTGEGTPQGSLCAAAHNEPYEQCRVMRSAGPVALVTATRGIEHCA